MSVTNYLFFRSITDLTSTVSVDVDLFLITDVISPLKLEIEPSFFYFGSQMVSYH